MARNDLRLAREHTDAHVADAVATAVEEVVEEERCRYERELRRVRRDAQRAVEAQGVSSDSNCSGSSNTGCIYIYICIYPHVNT